jgi:hypothetical protein
VASKKTKKAKKAVAKAKDRAKKDASQAKKRASKRADKKKVAAKKLAKKKAKKAKRVEKKAKKRRNADNSNVSPLATPAAATAEPSSGDTIVVLRAKARELSIPGYSRLTKAQLLERISAGR